MAKALTVALKREEFISVIFFCLVEFSSKIKLGEFDNTLPFS